MADLNDIINTLIAEAYGEGDEGMRRVGETILNRSAIRGIDPAAVVRQPSQYTGFFAPGPDAVRAQQDPIARSAAEAAWQLAKQPGDPTNGADHYFNPNIVSPGWKNSMVPTGDYKDHSFYRSREVPADALAALLTPATREVAFPRARPETRQVDLPRARPQSPGDVMANLFGTSFSAPRDPATATALDQYLARQTAAGGNLTMPGQIDRSVGALTQQNGLAEALAAMVAPRAAPAMPTSARQSFAGQERAPDRSAITAASARQAADQLTLRNANQQAADAERNRTVVATVPTSNIGKPPTTRVVQSVPVSTPAPRQTTAEVRADNGQARQSAAPKTPTSTPQRSTALTVGAVPNFAGSDRAAPSRINDIGSAPSYSDLAMTFGGTPNARGSVNDKKPTERLPAGGSWTVSEAERLALHGVEPPPQVNLPNSAAQVPLPRRRPDAQQNTQVAITTPRRVAPTPAQRQQQGLNVPQVPRRQAEPDSPLRIVVPGGNYRAPMPAVASTRINQLRAQGMSAAAAYEALNAAARGASSLEDRVTGKSSNSGASAFSLV